MGANRHLPLKAGKLKAAIFKRSWCTDSKVFSFALSNGLKSITERIEYKLFSLTYEVPTTTQPLYLHNLISVQRPCSTCSSSIVTLARPPSSSSLKITDRTFRYASSRLWNKLSSSLCDPHSGTSSSISNSPIPSSIISYFFVSPLCSSITPLSFTLGLKPTAYTNPSSRSFTSSPGLPSWTIVFFWATRFLFLFFLILCFWCHALD